MRVYRAVGLAVSALTLTACQKENASAEDSAATESPSADSDGSQDTDAPPSDSEWTRDSGETYSDEDCMSDSEEAELGTDPTRSDSDGDGLDDCAERDCGSDPLDAEELCYTCGWERSPPSSVGKVGPAVGDTIANLRFYDQCEEEVELWDFAGEYHLLFLTAAW